jgi:CRP-like cAMP-binding protein
LIRPGEFYGEDAVTSENAHSSVEAFDDVFLYLIDSDDFKVCLVEHPRLALALIRALSGTIRQLCLLLIEESG